MTEVFTLHNLPRVEDCTDYTHYCRSRSEVGLQCIPVTLFERIREDALICNEMKISVDICSYMMYNSLIKSNKGILLWALHQ